MTGKVEAESEKCELRALMLEKRRTMPAETLARLSRRAQLNLLAQPAWRDASGVALYHAFRNEVDTAILLDAALETSKNVFLPRVRRGEAGVIDFVRCRGAHELACGAYNIMEPAPELPACVFTAPDAEPGSEDRAFVAPELFIIPGVAFDRKGRRLGFGGGYYDRFLSNPLLRARSLFVGLAYSFQVVDSLPAESWDEPMNALCTDAGYLEFRR